MVSSDLKTTTVVAASATAAVVVVVVVVAGSGAAKASKHNWVQVETTSTGHITSL